MTRTKFCYLLLMGSFLLTSASQAPISAQEQKKNYAAVLSVKNMCCAKESVPAIKELSKVPGVGRVSVDYKTRTLMIEPGKVPLSPLAVWEAAERVHIEPYRLATPEGVFNGKPRR